MVKHLLVSEFEIARRSDLMPPTDGGRAEAMRERLSWFERQEFTVQTRYPCPGKCGRYVASGLCAECDGMCLARLIGSVS